MKIYKYIGVALMVLSLGACKTDELERDIDALKDRVTAMEAKVDRLNESMNMIRVALDGNKTIQSYTENEDGSYTLTLSDGNTITLTQGEIGATDVYQEVSISTDGNWVIGGVETEHRALAVGGEPGVTPQFRLTMESEGKYYWEVSYDGELTWEEVKSQQGTRVYASASGSSSVAGPIASAAPNATGDKFEITLTSNGTKYEIPIVSGLACAITEPNPEDMENGYWIVPITLPAVTTSTSVDLKGDAVLVSAPEGWTVTAEIGNGTLTIIPPAQDGAEGIITLQVNKGIYWAIDQIKVRSKRVITSLKAEYELGDGFYIGDELVSKETYPGGTLIENGGTISNSGVHFIAGGATIEVSEKLVTGEANCLVLVGNDPNNPSTILFKDVYLENHVQNLLFKNIKLVRDGVSEAYLLKLETPMNKAIFDNCEIQLAAGFIYGGKEVAVNTIQLRGNKVKFINSESDISKPKTNVNFCNVKNLTLTNLEITNNVFWTVSQSGDIAAANGQFVTLKKGDNMVIKNNTFCNYFQNPQGITTILTSQFSLRNNIFYNDGFGVASNLINAQETSQFPESYDAFELNVAYNETGDGKKTSKWNICKSGSTLPSPDYSKVITPEEQSPLQIVDWEKGEFVSLKAGYGAAIE